MVLTGFVTDLQLAALYRACELFVFPSLYEGFSLPAIEAMACRVPLVATRAGAIPEVVGDAAVLVPPRDAGALAVAISDLLDDKARRIELGADGRRHVLKNFTWAAAADRTVQVYERALLADR